MGSPGKPTVTWQTDRVRRTRFDDWPCPIARVTDLMGDWWTPLVLREAFFGRKRFDDFQEALGVSRPILAQRLRRLVEEGVMERVVDRDNPRRHVYLLTDKGRDLWGVLAAMWRWGVDWAFDEAQPSPWHLYDTETGAEVHPRVVDEQTGEPLDVRRLRASTRRQQGTPAAT